MDSQLVSKNPIIVTKLRLILGFSNIFRRFVPTLAHVAAPLNKTYCKSQRHTVESLAENEANPWRCCNLHWCNRCARSSTFVRFLPRWHWSMWQQIGCINQHKKPDRADKTSKYFSPFLNNAESSYDTTHWECLYVVKEILLLCPHLTSEVVQLPARLITIR